MACLTLTPPNPFDTDESVLMDLKALLIEAKQKVPPVLQVLQTGDETMLDIGGKRFWGCMLVLVAVSGDHAEKTLCGEDL